MYLKLMAEFVSIAIGNDKRHARRWPAVLEKVLRPVPHVLS